MRAVQSLTLLVWFCVAANALAKDPFIGEWWTSQGDLLRITPNMVEWGNEAPVPYRDITRKRDGYNFNLEIIQAPDEALLRKTGYLELFCDRPIKATMLRVVTYADPEEMWSHKNPHVSIIFVRKK
jgi:hypothetical protein